MEEEDFVGEGKWKQLKMLYSAQRDTWSSSV